MTPTMSTWCSNQLSYNPVHRCNGWIITHCGFDCKQKFERRIPAVFLREKRAENSLRQADNVFYHARCRGVSGFAGSGSTEPMSGIRNFDIAGMFFPLYNESKI